MKLEIVVGVALLFSVVQGTLYGYYAPQNGKPQIVAVDPSSGNYKPLSCDLSNLPTPLSGASSNTDLASGLLQFYYLLETGDILLVKLNPSNCKITSSKITGLNGGQDDVRDMKYGGVAGSLYMVFPDPNCLHGSLDAIDANAASVQKTLQNVVDPDGFSQITAVSSSLKKYYYVGLPFPPISLNYLLNIVDLTTGDAANVTLANNTLGLGDMFGTNFTMSSYDTPSGISIFGAISPAASTLDKFAATPSCSPSGFYTVDATSGVVKCVGGPLNLVVYPLSDLDRSTNTFYQIFTDSAYKKFYLVSFDAKNFKILSQVNCEVCAQLTTLSVL